jgi:hypothetical protein
MADLPEIPDFALSRIGKAEKKALPVAAPEGIAEADGLPAGVGEGKRNEMAARIAGRYLAKLRPEEVWPIFVAWNRKNRPPLSEDELRSVLFSIARKERDKAPLLELVDSSELSRLNPAPAKEIVSPFLRAGSKNILAAWQGGYKSTLALNMAVSIRNELPLFGRFNTTAAKVLYVDRENPPGLTEQRVEKIARGLHGARGGILFSFPKEKTDLADRRVRETYARIVDKEKIELLIFDSFLPFFNLRNENDNTEVRNVLELVNELPDNTGCAVLFIDHAAKATPDKAKAGIKVMPRGAGAKGDWADVVMTLEEREDEARKLRVLRFPKTRFNVPIPAVVLEVRPDLVMVPSGDDEICPVFTVRTAVEDHPGIGAGELHAFLTRVTGCSTRTAMRSTSRAVELRFLLRVEKGRKVAYHPPISDKADVTNSEEAETGGQKTLVYQ